MQPFSDDNLTINTETIERDEQIDFSELLTKRRKSKLLSNRNKNDKYIESNSIINSTDTVKKSSKSTEIKILNFSHHNNMKTVSKIEGGINDYNSVNNISENNFSSNSLNTNTYSSSNELEKLLAFNLCNDNKCGICKRDKIKNFNAYSINSGIGSTMGSSKGSSIGISIGNPYPHPHSNSKSRTTTSKLYGNNNKSAKCSPEKILASLKINKLNKISKTNRINNYFNHNKDIRFQLGKTNAKANFHTFISNVSF